MLIFNFELVLNTNHPANGNEHITVNGCTLFAVNVMREHPPLCSIMDLSILQFKYTSEA